MGSASRAGATAARAADAVAAVAPAVLAAGALTDVLAPTATLEGRRTGRTDESGAELGKAGGNTSSRETGRKEELGAFASASVATRNRGIATRAIKILALRDQNQGHQCPAQLR